MKIVNIDGENLYLLSDLRNINNIFRKDVTYDDVTYDNIRKEYIFGKTRGGVSN